MMNSSLMIKRWIVTAGHCHDDSFPLDVAVLGEHDVLVETETMIKIVGITIVVKINANMICRKEL